MVSNLVVGIAIYNFDLFHTALTITKSQEQQEQQLQGLRKGSCLRNGYFTVRLTVSVDQPPPPPYGQLFVIFFGVLWLSRTAQ